MAGVEDGEEMNINGFVRDLWRFVVGEPDPPLPPFRQRPMCSKCGYWSAATDISVRYVRILGGDALERACPRCGATWLMQCADAEEER